MKKLFGYGPNRLSKKEFIEDTLQAYAFSKMIIQFGFLRRAVTKPNEPEDAFFERLIRTNYRSVSKDPRVAYKKLEAHLKKESHIAGLVNLTVEESLETLRAKIQLGLVQAGLTDSPEFRLASYAKTVEELHSVQATIEQLYGLK